MLRKKAPQDLIPDLAFRSSSSVGLAISCRKVAEAEDAGISTAAAICITAQKTRKSHSCSRLSCGSNEMHMAGIEACGNLLLITAWLFFSVSMLSVQTCG